MLLNNLRKLKEVSDMTYEEIAEKSKTSLSTVKNIFSGKCEPLASTLYRIVDAMGGSLDDVLADTNIVLSPKTLVEVQKNAETAEAELETMRTKTAEQEKELLILRERVFQQDRILSLIDYFAKINPVE